MGGPLSKMAVVTQNIFFYRPITQIISISKYFCRRMSSSTYPPGFFFLWNFSFNRFIPIMQILFCMLIQITIYYSETVYPNEAKLDIGMFLGCSPFKEYLKFFNRLYDITWFWCSLRLINRETIYEKRTLFQTRFCKYNLFKNFKYSL